MKRSATFYGVLLCLVLMLSLSGCKKEYSCKVTNLSSGYTWYEYYQAKDADEAWDYCQDDWGSYSNYSCYACTAQ